jgi:glycosyltransferase involved in cell wall biosynthesis
LDKHLHIICLNVPYPVDYGGVFDLFYKLPALQKQGVKIHLHCFEYGRGKQPELNKYCHSVHYYQRQTGLGAVSFKLPYIVSSRNNKELVERLLLDHYPILMEGVHCTSLLSDTRFQNRKCFVRLHNVEHVYYHHLYKNSTSLIKKLYYWWESRMLKTYEASIANRAHFWTVIKTDITIYEQLGAASISYLPLFLPLWKVESSAGSGNYCLYQGDLSVPENDKAARWLLEIFKETDIPLVIAGKNPPRSLQHLVNKFNNICLLANPGNDDMQDVIRKAHIHIIPSYNSTGIKLKLLNALYNGRHCIVNNATILGTGLDATCHIANTTGELKQRVTQLLNQPFTERELAVRKSLLEHMFDNNENAIQVVKQVWHSD